MLRTVTAAEAEPVSLAEAKQHLAVIHAADDVLIGALITAARETVERVTGYALVEAAYEWSPEGGRREPLPIWPGVVTSAADDYPILFSATPGPVPAPLKAAILLLVGDLYANREAGTEERLAENPTFDRLIWPFRRVLP